MDQNPAPFRDSSPFGPPVVGQGPQCMPPSRAGPGQCQGRNAVRIFRSQRWLGSSSLLAATSSRTITSRWRSKSPPSAERPANSRQLVGADEHRTGASEGDGRQDLPFVPFGDAGACVSGLGRRVGNLSAWAAPSPPASCRRSADIGNGPYTDFFRSAPINQGTRADPR